MTSDNRSMSAQSALGHAMLARGLSFRAINDVVSHAPVFTLLSLRFSVTTVFLGIIGRSLLIQAATGMYQEIMLEEGLV